MNQINEEQRNRYISEMASALVRGAMEPQLSKDGFLVVLQDGMPLCQVSGRGVVRYRPEDISGQEQEAALNRVTDLVSKVAEYMNLMESALPLKVNGLDENYRLLADFNGIVLAGHDTKYGVQFVTWDWDYEKTGVTQGALHVE